MKKYILLIATVLVAVFAQGIQQDVTPHSLSSVNVRIDADYHSVQNGDAVKEGIVSHTVALLAEDVEIIVNNIIIGVYDSEGTIVSRKSADLQTGNTDLTDRVYLSNSFIFREMYGFTVNTDMIVEENGLQSIVEFVDFDIIGIGSREMPDFISEAFYHSYMTLADNYRDSYMVNIPFKQPAMLIINHNAMTAALEPFVKWKKEAGMQITVVNKEDIAPNANSNQIRNYIRNFYLEAENKPDFLVLIGDVSGNFPMPTFYHPPQNDATDLPYTMIIGDDYFPEMLVGRLSVSNAYHLATIVNKTLYYEKNPNMTNTDWMKSALIAAGNFATSLPIPITPVLTSRWIAELLENSGYEFVTTVFWHVGMGGYGTAQIIEAINRGIQVVNYRGWGDSNGWHYPKFHISDLSTTQGGNRTPVVTSFVCNTGDFANPTIDPCFGEYWMRMGTPVSQNGSVAFLGPSDLYTSTEYNNSLSSGYHWGVQREGIRTFASGLLRGKMEMYRNYPNNRGLGDWVEHYFKVYNILSDPSMKMWVLVPNRMNVNIPNQISNAACHIEFDAPGLSGGYVTVTRNHEDYQTIRIYDDHVFIPLNAEAEGDIWITVTAENYIPVQKTIEVVPADHLAMIDYNFGGSNINPGSEINLNVTIKNFDTNAVNGVTAQLVTNSGEYVDIIDGTHNFGNLPANGTAEGNFSFTIAPNTPRFTAIQFTMNISPTNDVAKIQTIVGGLLFNVEGHQVDSENGVLDPGESALIQVSIKNNGEVAAQNLTAFVVSGTDAVAVQEGAMVFGNVPVGGTAQASFSATAAADAFIGRQVYFQLNFTDDVGLLTIAHFNITLGNVTNTHPTGPDRYGYYAYDSFDTDYEYAPTYEWIDIDPKTGGPGQDMWLHDDGTTTMDLPFTFRYYGRNYNEISICSNGWVSLIPTWMINFRNWSIPSAENPYGIIAPFWDDLKGRREVGDSLRVAWYHDEANNRFIVSWLDAYNVARIMDDGVEKIQVILEPRPGRDGDIVFQYHTIWNQNQNRNYSTTGIQSHCNTMGLEYSFFNIYPPSATPIQAGLAIRVTTDAPDSYTVIRDVTAPQLAASLSQNYPNPFNPETVIEFNLPTASFAGLEIYNVKGQKVRTLIAENLNEGNHRVVWNGRDDRNRELSSGVYLYKLVTPYQSEIRRMIMMK